MAYLIDNSAFTRRRTRPEIRAVVEPLLLNNQLSTCAIVDLELLFSAEGPTDYKATAEALLGMPRIPVDEECCNRALAVQAMLAQRSQHRGVSLPDLLVAACAERAELTVLHYDADFERISAVTGQPTQWVLPRGSVS